MVEVLDSPSIFLQGMAGSRLPIVVSHGEGFANFAARGNADQVVQAMRYVDNHGQPTEVYPFNPNRQRRRPDGGDHGRRALHGHDAAPRARVPQYPNELDQRRPQCGQPLDARLAQCPASGWGKKIAARMGCLKSF